MQLLINLCVPSTCSTCLCAKHSDAGKRQAQQPQGVCIWSAGECGVDGNNDSFQALTRAGTLLPLTCVFMGLVLITTHEEGTNSIPTLQMVKQAERLINLSNVSQLISEGASI